MSEGHILVTGGSRGIGAAIVQGLLDRGYDVSCCSRSANDFTRGLPADHALAVQADLGDTGDLAQFAATAEARFGVPTGLVNCGAIAVDGVLALLDPGQIEQMIRINVTGTILLTRDVVRRMLGAGVSGSIVNISSVGALRGFAGLSAYAASKAAVDGFTRALARELGGRGIRVNSVAPGFVATEMTRSLDDAQRQQVVRRTPLGRLGTPDDIVGAVLFLLSPQASFITGQIVAVDGGLST